MCMLTYIPPFVQPDLEHLANGAIWNQDGHGFSIVAGNRLITRHSMDEWSLLDMFGELRAKHSKGPAMFHSRYGTAGTRDRRNCHPFRIGGDRRTVIGHNGVLPATAQPAKGDQRCDTRVCAEDIMRGQDLGDVKYRRALGTWMGKNNKFVILTVNPKYSSSAWIINESSGVWDANGIWYSNTDYQAYIPPTAVEKARWAQDGYWTGNTWREWPTVIGAKDESPVGGDWSTERCVLCTCYGEIDPAGFCKMCGTCQDCDMDRMSGECQCYVPASMSDEDEGAAAYLARQGDLEATFRATLGKDTR